MVRHGERIDETREGRSWLDSTPRKFLFDPPLTDRGAEQARAAGQSLLKLDKVFSRIYTSPLSRTLSTSEEIANILNCPVSVVRGLGSCAARVVKDGGIDKVPLLEPSAMCSRVDRVLQDAPLGFEEACRWIVQQNESEDNQAPILIVTHREGIRIFLDEHYRLPYCVIAHFEAQVDNDNNEWTLQSMVNPLKEKEQSQTVEACPSRLKLFALP